MKMNMNPKTAGHSASPDPMLQFMFAMFAVLTSLSYWIKMTEDAAFTMGVIQVSLGIGCFAGSMLNLRRGDPHGNINLILSVILGFAGGITQLASVYAKINHLAFHPWIMSVILLLGGIYMLCFLPLMDEAPLYAWCSHLFVVLGFLCNSIADLAGQPWLKSFGAVFLILFAITALYQGVSLMYQAYGRHLPQGPKCPFARKVA